MFKLDYGVFSSVFTEPDTLILSFCSKLSLRRSETSPKIYFVKGFEIF